MENTQKIDKEFVLSDSSKNVYGFKLLTSGYQLSEFKKLPIGFFNHKNKEDGALVRWEDLRLDGDMIKAKPVINLDHPRGQRTVNEINSGFISAASLAGLVILETTTEKDAETGKDIPVVTKWYNKEADLVTLPGNRNALAVPQLFDADDNEIQLSDLLSTTTKNETMQYPKAVLAALELSDGDDASVVAKIIELSDKAKRADAAEKAVEDLKKEGVKTEITTLLDAALKDGKITKELSDSLSDDYAGNPKGLASMLGKLAKPKSIVDGLKQAGQGNKEGKLYKELSDMNLEDMMEKELADKCLQEFPELFKDKFDAARGAGSFDKIYGGI